MSGHVLSNPVVLPPHRCCALRKRYNSAPLRKSTGTCVFDVTVGGATKKSILPDRREAAMLSSSLLAREPSARPSISRGPVATRTATGPQTDAYSGLPFSAMITAALQAD